MVSKGADSGRLRAVTVGRLPLPSEQDPQRAGFVELLFDVVFVFALTRVSARLVDHLSWANFYATVVLIAALWWVWYRMVWTTNRYDHGRPVIQLMVIVTMLATLLMATALPAAFTERGVVFVSVYVTLQIFRHVWLVLLGGDRSAQLVSVRIVFWACLSAVPWIAGLWAHDLARVVWWTVAVGLDYAGGALDFPTPKLGRAGLRGQRISEEHLTERYRQLLIIAFGETILTAGTQFSPFGFHPDRIEALLVAFTVTVLFWQIYFYRAGQVLPLAIAASKSPSFVGDLASYSHLIMVTGVSLSSVGDDLVISDPFGRAALAFVMVIFGGPAIFLIGRGLLDYAVFSHVSWSRVIGLLVLAALIPLALRLPLLLVGAVALAVLAGVAVANLISWRMFPVRIAPPPR